MTQQKVEILADERTGFPLIAIPGISFHVSWLPLTWIQLEYFLSETSDRRFDSIWYQDVIKRTGRTSTSAVNTSTFFNLFVRGLTLQEARSIGAWLGENRFVLPSAQEWKDVRQAAQALPMLGNAFEQQSTQRFNARAIRLMQVIEHTKIVKYSNPTPTLADQMLLNNGLRELVRLEAESIAAGGIGNPHRSVEAFPDKLLLALDDGNRARRPEVGLRLFLKP